ncbi:MAG: hypothetical protein U5N56_05250 [Candidatus Marinimicrobia bacterium]|nr:hypothetical protein [Candidatus Neomarinimicrobiota bacterium]
MQNLNYWVCTHPDNPEDTLEFYSLHDDNDTTEVGVHDTLVDYFGTDGFYHLINGTLFKF